MFETKLLEMTGGDIFWLAFAIHLAGFVFSLVMAAIAALLKALFF